MRIFYFAQREREIYLGHESARFKFPWLLLFWVLWVMTWHTWGGKRIVEEKEHWRPDKLCDTPYPCDSWPSCWIGTWPLGRFRKQRQWAGGDGHHPKKKNKIAFRTVWFATSPFPTTERLWGCRPLPFLQYW